MTISPETVAMIKLFEGISLTPYQDAAGVWTIGYGHTNGVNKGTPAITSGEAEALLDRDLTSAELAVDNLIYVPLNDNQYGALVSLCYNIGASNLRTSTLRRLLNIQDYHGAADQFLRWDWSNGKQVPGLSKRRAAERAFFLKPVLIANNGVSDG